MMVKLRVNNWAKYNERTKRANYSWFRMQNDFFNDQNIFVLTPEQKLLFIFILCECSKKSAELVELSLDYISLVFRSSTNSISENLQALENTGIVTREKAAKRRERAGKNHPTYRHTDRQDKTNEQDETYSTDPACAREIPAHPPELEPVGEILNSREVPENLSQTWLRSFPDPAWIVQEIRKAVAWESANPLRKKKNFGKFMTGWMNRGWDKRQLPGGRIMNSAEVRSETNKNAVMTYIEKVQRGEA